MKLIEFGPTRNRQLPSICPSCLQVQTFLRFAGIDFEICDSGNVRMGELPLLELNDGNFVDGKNRIFVYLSSLNFGIDLNCRDKDFDAYLTFAEE